MTATMPARQQTRYRGAIYGIDVLDHDTGLIVPDDYVGKTRQRGRLRELQHRDRQPFADRIVGDAHRLWEGLCTDDELAEMERHFIQDVAVRPRLNVEMNEDNPHRIPKWKQIEQRHQRDAAADRDLWVPYEQRRRDSLLEWDTPDRPAYEQVPAVRSKRVWKPWQKKTLAWSSGWLVSTIAGWIALVWWQDFTVWWRPPAISGSATGVIILWLLAGAPHPKKSKRRRKGRR